MNDFAPLLRQLQRQNDPLAIRAAEAIRSLIKVRDEMTAYQATIPRTIWLLDQDAVRLLSGLIESDDEGNHPEITLSVGWSKDDDENEEFGLRATLSDYPEEGCIPLAKAQLAEPVRLTEEAFEECKRLADIGSPVPHMSWSERLACSIEMAVLRANGFNVPPAGD